MGSNGWSENFAKMQEDAGKQIRKLKKASPYIFFEYNRMKTAERELEKAKEEYKEAKRIWQELGAKK